MLTKATDLLVGKIYRFVPIDYRGEKKIECFEEELFFLLKKETTETGNDVSLLVLEKDGIMTNFYDKDCMFEDV